VNGQEWSKEDTANKYLNNLELDPAEADESSAFAEMSAKRRVEGLYLKKNWTRK
jgi:hypothetical protein